MPAELRAAYIAAVQAEAPAIYQVHPGAAGLVAANPAQRLTAAFTEAGVQLAPSGEKDGWGLSMTPARWRCPGELGEVARAMPEVRDLRVEYQREGMLEWHVNGPLGLEQGFTLSAPLPCRSAAGGE
jgi:hypothetical protein